MSTRFMDDPSGNFKIPHISNPKRKVNVIGNCLELRTRNEESVLAISHTAVKSLTASNLAALQKHMRFIEVTVDIIEAIGGGGIRCMLAGVHLLVMPIKK